MFRIIVGSLATIGLFLLAFSFNSWYGPDGYNPGWLSQMYMPDHPTMGDAAPNIIPRFNLLYGSDNPMLLWGVWAVSFLAGIFTTLGLWTRVSAILLAAGMVSLHHRAAMILNGGDTVMRVSLIYLAISPCGAACSLDRVIAVWRGRAKAVPEEVSLWMQRVLCWNMAIIYFTTLWMKSWGSHWKDFTAIWYTGRLEEFSRFPVPQFMKEVPMVQIETIATIIIEFSLATLVFWRPTRKWVLLGGVLMHAYIEYSMNVPLFAFLMTSWYIAFYEGDEVVAWAKRFGQRFQRYGVVLTVPESVPQRALDTLAALDCFGLIQVERGAAWKAVRVAGGEISVNSALWTRLPGSWLWFWIVKNKWRAELDKGGSQG